jgi:hypothetical protein
MISTVLDPLNIMGSGTPSASVPNASDVGGQYSGLLNAMVQGLPEQMTAQQTYGPQYTQQGLQQLEDEMLGVNGTPGYLSIYGGSVVPAITGATTTANTAARAAGVNDLATLGPGAVGAVAALDPGQSALMNSLTGTATQQLGLGTQLDPTTSNNIISGVRSNWGSRGLGVQPQAQLSEAMQLEGGGQNLLSQRESAAGSVATLNNNMYTNPAMEMLGVNSPAAGQAQTLTSSGENISSNVGPSIIPTSQTSDLFNTAYNANAAASITNANNAAAIQASSQSY